jgi:NTE family protein
MLFTENAANSSLDRRTGQPPLQNRTKNDALPPVSPCSHNFCLAEQDRGINHACDAIGCIIAFLLDLVFFMRGVVISAAKSDVSPMVGVSLEGTLSLDSTLRSLFVLENLIGRGPNGANGRDRVGLGSVRRPVIGLALGGGAARGFAHIGIVRTLIAHGIVPNVVVGTSIGAVVGGSYAAGHLDTLEEWARSLQPRNILSYLDIRLNGSGLIGGDKLAAQLEAALGQTDIEDLPLKFASVATEVQTGHEIWLTHGRIVDAMRASYALPGIFSPVLVGDRWLVDGALVNPVPVSAARALGAEIVIAANLSSDVFAHSTTIYAHGAAATAPETAIEVPPPRRGFSKFFSPERTVKREFFGGGGRPGISKVMVDAFNIMQDRITRARLAGDPPDLLISPRVGQIGWFDFHRADDLIAHGARAAERAIDSIQEAIHILTPTPGVAPNNTVDKKP